MIMSYVAVYQLNMQTHMHLATRNTHTHKHTRQWTSNIPKVERGPWSMSAHYIPTISHAESDERQRRTTVLSRIASFMENSHGPLRHSFIVVTDILLRIDTSADPLEDTARCVMTIEISVDPKSLAELAGSLATPPIRARGLDSSE